MRLLEVSLENVGAYAGGPHRFDFRMNNPDGTHRPIVLIHGQNGAGKTTFLHSILLCIHGARAMGPGASRKDYQQRLAELVPHGMAVGRCGVSVELRYQPREGAAETFMASRAWWLERGKIREQFEVYLNGDRLDEDSYYRWEAFTDSQFPASIAPLFLFDAERSGQLLGQNVAGAGASAYSRVNGLDVADQLVDDLGKLLASLVRKSARCDEAERLIELESARDKAADSWRSARERAAEIQGLLDSATAQREACEVRLEADFEELADQRAELKATIAACESEHEQIDHALTERWTGLLPLISCAGLLGRTRRALEEEASLADPALVVRALREAGELVKAGSAAIDFNVDRAIQVLAAGIASIWEQREMIHDLSGSASSRLQAILGPELESEAVSVRNLLARRESVSSRFEAATGKLRRMGADRQVEAILQEARQAATDEGRLSVMKATAGSQVAEAWELMNALEGDIGSLEELIATREAGDDPISRTRRALEAARLYVREVREAMAERLGDAIKLSFNQLSRKGELLEGVKIDRQSGAIASLQSKFRDDVVVARMSAGEQQVLALSYLWALLRCDGRKFPVVIDTPFGRLDSEHRRNIVEGFLVEELDQVVLLVTDEEATAEFYKAVQGHVSREYWLSHDATKGVTSVVDRLVADKT